MTDNEHEDRRKFFLTLGAVLPKPHRGIKHVGEPLMAFQLRDSEQLPISVEALDSEGNPADGSFSFSSSDPSVADITDNGDGTAMVVASPGAAGLGTATITVTHTDLDGSTLEGTLDIEVIAGDAVAVNILPGTPEPKPVV